MITLNSQSFVEPKQLHQYNKYLMNNPSLDNLLSKQPYFQNKQQVRSQQHEETNKNQNYAEQTFVNSNQAKMDQLRSMYNQKNSPQITNNIPTTQGIQSYRSFCQQYTQPQNIHQAKQNNLNVSQPKIINQQSNYQSQQKIQTQPSIQSSKTLNTRQQSTEILHKIQLAENHQQTYSPVVQNKTGDKKMQEESKFSPKKFITESNKVNTDYQPNHSNNQTNQFTCNLNNQGSLKEIMKLQKVSQVPDKICAITQRLSVAENNFSSKKYMTDVSKLAIGSINSQRCFTEPAQQINNNKKETSSKNRENAYRELYSQLDKESISKVNLIMEQAELVKSRIIVL